MKRLLAFVLLLLILGCASGPLPGDDEMLIDVLQGTDEAPPTYLYTVLVSNVSGKVMIVTSVSVEPSVGGDVRFRNAVLTLSTTLEPGQQGEFRLWATAESDSGFFDREGPPQLRVVVSYTLDGVQRARTAHVKVQRVRHP